MLIVLAALNEQATAIVAVVALVLGVLFIARGPRSDWAAAPTADDEPAAPPLRPAAPAPAPAAAQPAPGTRFRQGRIKLGRKGTSAPDPPGEEVPAPIAPTAPAPVVTSPPVSPEAEPVPAPLSNLETEAAPQPAAEPPFRHGRIKLGRDKPAEAEGGEPPAPPSLEPTPAPAPAAPLPPAPEPPAWKRVAETPPATGPPDDAPPERGPQRPFKQGRIRFRK